MNAPTATSDFTDPCAVALLQDGFPLVGSRPDVAECCDVPTCSASSGQRWQHRSPTRRSRSSALPKSAGRPTVRSSQLSRAPD